MRTKLYSAGILLGMAVLLFAMAYGQDIYKLKWNASAEGAIAQKKDKKYMKALEGYEGEILLVGINYDKESKKHSCRIEKITP